MGLVGFVDRGIKDDDRKLEHFGVDRFSSDALPYYGRWVREDLIGVFFVLNNLSRYALLNTVLLVLIALPLWMIALR